MHPGPIGRGLSLLSNLFDLDYLYTSLTPSEEEIGDTEPAAAESRRKPLEKARDNGVRGHRRRPLTSALRCQRRHPPLPAATTGRRSARGLATLGARTRQYPHLEASVDFIYLPKRVACGWPNFIEKIKLQPVFNLVCLIVVGGQRLRPQIWGTSLPGVHIRTRIWLILASGLGPKAPTLSRV